MHPSLWRQLVSLKCAPSIPIFYFNLDESSAACIYPPHFFSVFLLNTRFVGLQNMLNLRISVYDKNKCIWSAIITFPAIFSNLYSGPKIRNFR
jgi:hypothetical protein